MKRFVNLRRWLVIAFVVSLSGQAYSLAITPLTQVFLPPGISNSQVRIKSLVAPGGAGGVGTGTVIDFKPDSSGPGGWVCVLTADHVIASDATPFTYHEVSFGDIGGGGPTFTSTTGIVTLRGPWNGTSRVDLGMIGFYAADLSTLPAITLPTLGGAAPGDVIDVDGYGLTATLDGVNRRYLVNEGTYGNLLASFNVVDSNPLFTVTSGPTTYTYTSNRSTVVFGPPGGTAIQANAHLLPGDSGGASWKLGTNTLVGVHSASELIGSFGSRRVEEGYHWWDVRVESYRPWIEDACMVVPEPWPFLPLGIGVLVLLRRRRK